MTHSIIVVVGIERRARSGEPKRRYTAVSPGRRAAMVVRWDTPWRQHMEGILSRYSDDLKVHGHSDDARVRMSEKKGGVGLKARPLFLRGATNDDVMQIAGLTRKQVDNQRFYFNNGRPKEAVARLDKRIGLAGRKIVDNKFMPREYSEEEQHSFFFARRLLEEGFITEDLSNWEALQRLYERYGRVVPESFSTRIRLEGFLSAQRRTREADSSQLEMYVAFGKEARQNGHEASLRQEESFLAQQAYELPWIEFMTQEGINPAQLVILIARSEQILNDNHGVYRTLGQQLALGLFLHVREKGMNGNIDQAVEVRERFSLALNNISEEEQEALREPMQVIIGKTPMNIRPQLTDSSRVIFGEISHDQFEN